jgi:hypothetical protein
MTRRAVMIAVEQKYPHDVVVYDVPAAYLASGFRRIKDVATRWRIAQATGQFDGQHPDAQILDVPEWAKDETWTVE